MRGIATITITTDAAKTLLAVCEGAIKIDTSLMQQLGLRQISIEQLGMHRLHLRHVVDVLKRAGITQTPTAER